MIRPDGSGTSTAWGPSQRAFLMAPPSGVVDTSGLAAQARLAGQFTAHDGSPALRAKRLIRVTDDAELGHGAGGERGQDAGRGKQRVLDLFDNLPRADL